jgi:photosystem II stability/assembly factor-like uncharacterized protein
MSKKKWLDSSRKLSAPVTLAAVILVAVGSLSTAAIAVESSGGVTPQHPQAPSHTVVRWVVPRSQISAPILPTAGGAAYGQGGFNGVACPSANECVAVGGDASLNGVVSVTSNGGSTWTQGETVSGSPALNSVACASTTSCVAVGNGAAAYSINGGVTWTTVSLPTADTSLLSVSCATSTSCVSVGVTPGNNGPLGGALLITEDGGNTWKSPQLPAPYGAVGSVDCPSSTFCVAVGAQILVSTDGGSTWSNRSVAGGTGVLRSVSCQSATTCVAIGPNPSVAQDSKAAAFEVVTSDGGATWHDVTLPPSSATLDVIFCYSGGSCQADGSALAGNAAPTLASTSVGSTWSTVATLNTEMSAVSAVSCGSATTCVYVGSNSSGPVIVASSGGVAAPPAPVSALVRRQKIDRR